MMVVRIIPVMKGVMYIMAQLLGAIAGAGLLSGIPRALHNGLGAHSVSPNISELDAVMFEFFLTFALVFVIFGTAVDSRGPGNTAPIVIGFTVFVDHLVGVPFTGASMNPARTLGPAVWEDEWDGFRVYLFGPLLGAACAAVAYTQFFPVGRKQEEEITSTKIHSMENPMFEHSRKFDKSVSGISRHDSPNIFMV
ncbi:hypothetical protein Mapa_010621 [Marchantia paleacea]|nr:hypothetical protein Mapa_010621 [Marchantia paleacea]